MMSGELVAMPDNDMTYTLVPTAPVFVDLTAGSLEIAIEEYRQLYGTGPMLLLVTPADSIAAAEAIKNGEMKMVISEHFPQNYWILSGPAGLFMAKSDE